MAVKISFSPSESIEDLKDPTFSSSETLATPSTTTSRREPTRYHSFSAAFDASCTRDRHANERASAAVMVRFIPRYLDTVTDSSDRLSS
jgi:hypothetical protein